MRQRGMVLVSSLLLLLVVTMIAITMFHSFGTQERIASNVREKQRALHAAESAQQYAEWWLSMGNGTTPITCGAAVTAPAGQICDTKLADPTNVPWVAGGAETGVIYTPPGMNVSTTVAAGTYYKAPGFYIAQVGLSPDGKTTIYQIDAVGYGARPDAVAVVESTYGVKVGVIDRGGL